MLKLLLRFFFRRSRVVRIRRQPARHIRDIDARDSGSRATTYCSRTGRPTETVSLHTATLSGKCYVIDGDTIQIGKVRLRLAGIDAPELEHPWGKKAKWELVRLCKGQIITARIEPDISYDRVVATCFLPGRSRPRRRNGSERACARLDEVLRREIRPFGTRGRTEEALESCCETTWSDAHL